MPHVPQPEDVRSTVERMQAWIDDPRIPERFRKRLQMRVEELLLNMVEQPVPVEIKVCGDLDLTELARPPKREPKQYVWMRAKGTLPADKRFHHCVAAYCSDHYLLMTSLKPHGITAHSNPRIAMMATIDHTIWLLYEMESTRTINGRGLNFGRIFTRDGKLVASTAQEGVVRAAVVPPREVRDKKANL
ncbi:hypothetical protein HK104_002766 [Borealophlyctis nickersoniae]|nr:hypothetical protein HK104_002766 [Borealophlyctis nickersoniae]